MKRNKKKKLNKIRKILDISYWAVFIVLAVTAILVIFTTFDSNLPVKMYTVQSGSMEPSIQTGSLIFVAPSNTYDVKDIISFKRSDKHTEIITHRISGVLYDQGGKDKYITKGDANDTIDTDQITKDNIIGKVAIELPYFGYLVSFAKTDMGTILLVIVPSVLFIISEIKNLKYLIKIYQKGGATA